MSSGWTLSFFSLRKDDDQKRGDRSEEEADEEPGETASILPLSDSGIHQRKGADADRELWGLNGHGREDFYFLPKVQGEPRPLEAVGSNDDWLVFLLR